MSDATGKAIGGFILAILIAGFFALVIWSLKEEPGTISPPSKLISYSSECGQNLRKMEWDGHLWISINSQGIVHHPDCPCGKKEFEKPEETSATE